MVPGQVPLAVPLYHMKYLTERFEEPVTQSELRIQSLTH